MSGDGNQIWDGPGIGEESEADSWADHLFFDEEEQLESEAPCATAAESNLTTTVNPLRTGRTAEKE